MHCLMRWIPLVRFARSGATHCRVGFPSTHRTPRLTLTKTLIWASRATPCYGSSRPVKGTGVAVLARTVAAVQPQPRMGVAVPAAPEAPACNRARTLRRRENGFPPTQIPCVKIARTRRIVKIRPNVTVYIPIIYKKINKQKINLDNTNNTLW